MNSSEEDWAGAVDGGWDTEAPALAEEAGTAPRALSDNRDVIVTGALYITVEDPTAAAVTAAEIVRDAGGRIDGRSETAPDDYNGGSAWLTLRIPTNELDTTVDELRDLGTVDEYTTDSYDVTNEVTDLEARISTLKASTARIESLLAQAEDISDIIKLETELADRQGTLEGLEARQRGLNDQVSMSTIDLSLTTEPVVIIDEEPPGSFWDGLVSGWNGLVSFLSGALVVIGVLLPWLALMALITFAVILAVRAGSARRARRRDVAPEVAHEQPVQATAAPQPPAPTANSAS